MELARRHQPIAGRHFVRWAWIATALIPVGLALATVVAFAGGEHGGSANHFAGAGLAIVALAAPAAAVFLALLAEEAGEHSARAALVVSTLLGVLVVLALPIAVVSGQAVLLAAGVYVVGIAVAGFARRHVTHD